MPRKSKPTGIKVLTSRSFQQHKIKSFNVKGRPPATVLQQTFPVVVRPSYMKAGIRRLIKRDVSEGRTMPEADALPFIAGVMAPGTSTYGNVKIMHQTPQVSPSIAGTGNKRRKIVAPPSPTNKGGIRNPYTQKRNPGRG